MLPCCDVKNGHKPRILVLEVLDKANTTGAPIAWIIVERVEVTDSMARKLELSYLRLSERGNVPGYRGEFMASYCPYTKLASLSSTDPSGTGYVRLDLEGLEGQRIGTYLMNEVVQWLKQWPDAEINPIELMSAHALDNTSKIRRNRFYERFGISFDFTDESQKVGKSRPMTASELQTVDTWRQNIREVRFDTYLEGMYHKQQLLEFELQEASAAEKHLNRDLREASNRPLRWALAILLQRHGFGLAMTAGSAVVAFLLWLWG